MSASLELTPESKRIVNTWGKEKSKWSRKNIDTFLTDMAEWMKRESVGAFSAQKQPGGSSWAPRKAGGKAGGSLNQSISHFINKSANEAGIKSSKYYSVFFNYGTIHMPARPFMADPDRVAKHGKDLFKQLTGA